MSACATAVGVMNGSATTQYGILLMASYMRGASMPEHESGLALCSQMIWGMKGSPVSTACSRASDEAQATMSDDSMPAESVSLPA